MQMDYYVQTNEYTYDSESPVNGKWLFELASRRNP
jgi:hypothetical protein